MTIDIVVPATTANIGPGFDCIGAALNLYNKFSFTLIEASPLVINVTGIESVKVATGNKNLVYKAFSQFYTKINQPIPRVQIDIELGIPLARGLGSSATAIIAGLMGANQLSSTPLSDHDLMQLAIAIEGHPDNVVPALLGGCRLATPKTDHSWIITEIPWFEQIIPIIGIPNFELSTEAARQALPKEYSRADAIYNISHLGLLIRALETGSEELLTTALNDKIHQPYRKSLITGFDQVYMAALEAKAYGLVISGAGPSILALSSPTTADQVKNAIEQAWKQAGVIAQVVPLMIDHQGTRCNITHHHPN